MEKHARSVKKDITHVVCLAILAALYLVLFVLSARAFRGVLSNALYYLILSGGSVLGAGLLVTDYVTYFLGKQMIYRFCIIALVFLIFVAAVAYALIVTGFLEVIRDAKKLEEYIERSGSWMSCVFILLQFAQVVILPIPSTVTVVAGAELFGPFLGSLYSLIGILIGSVCAFLIGRYAGHRVVAWIVGEETINLWLNKIKNKDKLFLSAMFLLPVFPDDVLCFVAGLSSMSFLFFLVVIFISRILAIFMTSYAIALIPFTTWWGLMIWGVFGAAVVALFVFLYKKTDEILVWIDKIFHRETRVKQEVKKEQFKVDIIDADGSVVSKGVSKKQDSEHSEPPE